MVPNTRCSCGMEMMPAEGDASRDLPCLRCGRPVRHTSQVSAAPVPASNTLETVALKPYYALEASPLAPAIAYRVVELPNPTPAGGCPEPISEARKPYDAEAATRESRREIEEREVRLILAKIRRDLHSHPWLRPAPWRLENNGWQCLVYPLRFWGAIVRLALAWAVMSPLLVLALPTPDTGGVDAWFPRLPFLVFPLALLGMTWTFLRQVLRLGILGDNETYPRLFQNIHTLVSSGFMVVAAFLAGPIVLLAAAAWFWVHAGALEWFDHVLLWQLWLCAGVGWVYLLLAVDGRGRLRDAQAGAVAPLLRRQGWPALVFPFLGGASLTVFGYLSIRTWILLFDEGILAFMLQFLLWCAGLSVWTFLLRWYGMTRYWRRQGSRQSSQAEDSPNPVS
jgi:hypothetical protein